jgi:hypothetical protein
MVRTCLLAGLLCSLCAACAPQAPERITAVQNYNAKFLCDGNQPLQVHFAPFKAALESQGVSVDMDQQPAAAGFRYAGGGQDLRQQGHEATWTDGKGAAHHCRETGVTSPEGNATVR